MGTSSIQAVKRNEKAVAKITTNILDILILFILNILVYNISIPYCLFPTPLLKLKVIGKCRDNRENTDLLEFIYGNILAINIFAILLSIVEERVMMVVNIINTDLENALSFVFHVRLDKLHANI